MQKFSVRKSIVMLATCAVLIAVYIVLGFWTISIGGNKITFEHFPVVLAAVLFGPSGGVLVGGVGELLNQLFTFGLTPTTVLWVLPIVVRGLLVGLAVKVFRRGISIQGILSQMFPIGFFVICIISGIVSSLFNTLALYVDSKMFGYYSFALVFGALVLRLILSAVTSVIIGLCIKPILHALRKAQLV